MNLIPEIEASHEEIKALRRTIHANPELRYEEVGTAKLVAENLERWGLEVHRGMGKTGVVGVLKRGSSSRSIGLRADMDALPITELNTFDHKSQNAGRMHACGHDGHTAMLLGAAQHLAKYGKFDGTIVFIFQPAEEGGAGAKAMIHDGLFEQFPVDAVFGIHNWPGMKAGTFGVTEGPLMASSNEFRISVKGIGSHAALPHNGRDPIFAAMQIANGLQGIITRSKKPIDTAVLSITQIHAGDAVNVVPDDAWLGGTVRTFTVETLDLIERRMKTIVESTAAAYECEGVLEFYRNYPPTINDAEQARFAVSVMEEIVGKQNVNASVEPTMGAEDFSFMLLAKPGCYAFLGNGEGEHRESGHGAGPCMLHNASYDFNDDLLSVGSTYFVKLADRFLSAR
ncbi:MULTISPECIES: M20 aminoacylase family protein [Burkholderiaceae]|jgi:amidohydrolase|uniref:Catalyzes the cleavage of p-aminobenzoyl-glutamate to p-aminobenzoate and glutamate, subunit A n=1 Tax=Caballeronia sordidicola TaxID=196367 RepID=A0A242MD23_CABSO|nr:MULTISPECIES: M20 aminoacylase family protein [Burkholderiaceae]AME23053.1 amidohydrolase [Burkholderia sp. PAMC 26561]AMM14925.1 amidohydrolase [Burkholderia sp. PAMC 28687]MDP9158312.1 M20 family metallopeptidase [Pseudomonadota bacterium]OTP69080.1 Catalyzes the cleavage of p-aminobenzoyl-glutamate to p-aminobenzoate and glutamate, subunit A [Caballeronia sordidicola]